MAINDSEIKDVEKDGLTGICNELYLKNNYTNYISKYPKSNFIMFDFKKFKHYNDVYGHETGDIYLKLFADILDEHFQDSIVVRLHGDEYAILTKYSYKEITELFDMCDARITFAAHINQIPEEFKYNAGIVPAEHGIRNTTSKADYMMYYAKQNDKRQQNFDEQIWNQKIAKDNFFDKIDSDIKNSSLLYNTQRVFDRDGKPTGITNITTRTSDKKTPFAPEMYNQIKANSQLKKIDLYNLRSLLSQMKSSDEKIIINVDFNSLLSKSDIVKDLSNTIKVNKVNPNNVIISINTNDLQTENAEKVIRIISSLKELGFEIGIDRYNENTNDAIYLGSDVDYVKMDPKYWKKAMVDPKTDYLFKKKMDLFLGYVNPTIPILTTVEKENEYIYLSNVTNGDFYVSGSFLEPERETGKRIK